MKFSKRCKIETVAEKDYASYHLDYVSFDATSGTLTASNGKVLAVIHVQDQEKDESALIPPAVIKAARKGRRGDAQICVNGEFEVHEHEGGLLTFPRNTDYVNPDHFPKVSTVMPSGDPAFRISLDAKMLWGLAQAIGSEQIALEFYDDGKPFVVRSIMECADTRNYGLQMPISEAKP